MRERKKYCTWKKFCSQICMNWLCAYRVDAISDSLSQNAFLFSCSFCCNFFPFVWLFHWMLLFSYDLHIPRLPHHLCTLQFTASPSPLPFTVRCHHRRGCAWTCNDKFYWKVSLTRIFISSFSFPKSHNSVTTYRVLLVLSFHFFFRERP